jgi:outer membrane protein OmpA-like peptidoglycan-associated protein
MHTSVFSPIRRSLRSCSAAAVVLSALCGSALLATPTTALAEPAAGVGELGLFLGYSYFGDDNEIGNAYNPEDVPGRNGFALGLRGGYNVIDYAAVEGEIRYGVSSFGEDGDTANMLALRANVLGQYPVTNIITPFVLIGMGSETVLNEIDDPTSDVVETKVDGDMTFYAGIGSKFDMEDWGARIDLRYGSTAGRVDDFAPIFEVLVGAYLKFGGVPKDRDADGIPDKTDKCPDRAEDKDQFDDADGCPETDNDEDGIPDANDKCPNEPETKNGMKDSDGCPDGDKDGDGIEDGDDKCPGSAEDKDGFEDKDGCPELDNDGDGILDTADKCPNKKEDRDGWKDGDGCPEDDDDKDSDGVPDKSDKCPDKPETLNGYEDADGCPDRVPDKVQKTFEGKLEGIKFKTGSAEIARSSFTSLEKVLAVFGEFPNVKVEVSGHTDNTGDHDKNMALSLERAKAVKAWFVEHGVAADRIKAVGHGDEHPVADNAKASGRKQNRRIEFHLLK